MTRADAGVVALACAALAAAGGVAVRGQSSPALAMTSCDAPPAPPFCLAVRGDRAEGWLAQSSERSDGAPGDGRHEPAARGAGRASDFAAGRQRDRRRRRDGRRAERRRADDGRRRRRSVRDHLQREGAQALCAERERHGAVRRDARAFQRARAIAPILRHWGPASGMPPGGILPVTVPGTVWGWDAVQRRFGKMTFKEVLAARDRLRAKRIPSVGAHRARLGAAAKRCRFEAAAPSSIRIR